jgi:hypothetical protein
MLEALEAKRLPAGRQVKAITSRISTHIIINY